MATATVTPNAKAQAEPKKEEPVNPLAVLLAALKAVLASDVQVDMLRAIWKYDERNKLAVKGILYFTDERLAEFAQVWIRKAIEQRFKALEKSIERAEKEEKQALFDLLISKGMTAQQAYDIVYSTDKVQPEQTAKPVTITEHKSK